MADSKLSRKPRDDAFRQQKLKSWQFIISPLRAIAIFFAIGVAFVPTGTYLIQESNKIYESVTIYDGSDMDVDCSIEAQNVGRQCKISVTLDKDVSGPLNVYYELRNFYQNQRSYVASLSISQLQGSIESQSTLDTDCQYKVTNGTLLLNPCGLIANSFFTDIITLDNTDLTMRETNIAWSSDKELKFEQPKGFAYAVSSNQTADTCSSLNLPSTCQDYTDPATGTSYKYYYPNDATTQYLYETYPDQISPIEGVTNEHFVVWMRTAGMPTFRKIYGKIDSDFNAGDVLNFTITANYQVDTFDGTKALVIGTTGPYGGKNVGLGLTYIIVGAISLFFGTLFSLRQLIVPRQLGDKTLLQWE